MQLSAANLQKATSEDPPNSKCPQATRNIADVADEFTRALVDGTLAEDDIIDEVTGSRTRFLGNHRDMPFFMVRAGEGFFAEDGEGRKTNRPARVPPVTYRAASPIRDNAGAKPRRSSEPREVGNSVEAYGKT